MNLPPFSQNSKSSRIWLLILLILNTAVILISYFILVNMFQYAFLFYYGALAILALTYLGSERVVPNYNTMGLAKAALESATRYLASSLGKEGIRANAISAGPIKTLAASGIQDFAKLLHIMETSAPLGRTVTIDEVGNAAAFLLSDLASGITGNVAYVDAGFHAVAVGAAE